MKVSQQVRKVIEIGQDDLLNVTELLIVINPGQGIEEKTLLFDSQFNQIFHSDKEEEKPALISTPGATASIEECHEPNSEVNEEMEQKAEEALTFNLKPNEFLPPLPENLGEFKFKNQKLRPYNMTNVHAPLQEFIDRFIFWGNKKDFEEKAYAFFLESVNGQKFGIKTLDTWGMGLWMFSDPNSFLEACKGAPTFRAVEFSFSQVKNQLKERIIYMHGSVPCVKRAEPKIKRIYKPRAV